MNCESQTTEYKEQWHDKYLSYISGFANAKGGTLYLGINDAGEIVGVSDARYLLENLPNKAVQATGVIPEIEILNDNGKDYIAIRVKPSVQPVSCNGKFYMRSGSTLQELNGNALTDFLMRQTHTTWDMHIEPEATIDDIDPEAVDCFVNFAIDAKRLDESAKHESMEHISVLLTYRSIFAIPPNSASYGLLEEFFYPHQRCKISITLSINLLGVFRKFPIVPKINITKQYKIN